MSTLNMAEVIADTAYVHRMPLLDIDVRLLSEALAAAGFVRNETEEAAA